MKKKTTDIELVKDDEILREESMCDGPAKILGNLELRPITALSVSWMQRNEIFGDAKDMIWKSAAFTYLHSAPKPEIRRVVNDQDAFMDAVDAWIEKNLDHHLQTTELATAMNQAFTRYMAAASEALGSKGTAPGN
jgi:hypothetical protein